ncbi:hypothetical protein GPJ56_002904 [Histomonas meleagridis]|uniref:uncharacterized protein n=1 Tax=Histomonas meleagridis TaxID=135588 RepID=UPI00355A8138|nr:hypothetical protein GPJ56_002904 [Histomonas meleagridis]KAH0800395.1 hypothetical protein GO595_006806 [Histomonas meleagridis]
MVENMIDVQLCGEIGISPETFENVMNSLLETGNIQASVISNTLLQATDFALFHQQMLENNIRIETSISEILLKITEDSTITDAEIVASRVAEIVAKQETEEIDSLIEKGCRQMRALLDLDLFEEKLNKRQQKKNDFSKTSTSPLSKSLIYPKFRQQFQTPLASTMGYKHDETPQPNKKKIELFTLSDEESEYESSSSSDSSFDFKEVERRRKFYQKQRDIIVQQEKEKGKNVQIPDHTHVNQAAAKPHYYRPLRPRPMQKRII